ncbi:MAG: ABC transporter ATP-binding protein/permease [Lachnospiraceae bacterium]|nr:ABC transporter ATP-binding protein/permease [Lachnospiraceae bacterium]
MIKMLHRILKFCDAKNARNIRIAYIFSFLKSFLRNAPVMVAVLLIRELMEDKCDVIMCCMMAGLLFAMLVLSSVFQHIADRFQSASGYKVFAEKRKEFAAHLRRLPMGYFTAGNIGKISSILSEDMVFIEENSMNVIAVVVGNIFSQLMITVFMFVLSPYLGVVMIVAEIIILCVAVPMNNESLRNSAARQQSVEELSGAVIEYAEGLGVSKSFGMTGESVESLRAGFAKSRDANLTFEREHTPWERALEVLYALGSGAVLAVAVWLTEKSSMDNASFIGVMLFLLNLFTPLKSIFQLGSRFTIMVDCLNRLEKVFAEKELSMDGTSEPIKNAEHEIEFSNVSFSYENEEILHDISFKADKGQMVALVGESGSGKTTIANLLARFWDINSGSIRVRGVDIREMSMGTLMDHLSMVFQKVYLFEDSVYNNIAMGRSNATRQEVIEAAKKARCYDFIMQLPYGFDTIIGEGGATLSGGEAQRISIARCILKDAPIIILDEATASIDADNERYIKEAMSELCKNKTVLVIAHRLNTIQSAEQILVLDHGVIKEHGNHEKLMAKKGIYYRMSTVQRKMNEMLEEVGA